MLPAIITLIFLCVILYLIWFYRRLISTIINVRNKYSSSFNPNEYIQKIQTSPKKYYFTSHDKLKLCFSHFAPEMQEIKGIILLVHGIRFGKEYFYPVAEKLTSQGYHCLTPDLRAHGESEGQFCTYGYLEKKDLKALLTFAKETLALQGRIGIWGHSLGASIALQTMAIDLRIKFGILEAPFSGLLPILNEYVERKYAFIPTWFVNLIIHKAAKKAGFNASSIDLTKIARTIEKPVMFIHGQNDDRIAIHHSVKLYDCLPTDQKIFYEIKNADHHNVASVWGTNYIDRTTNFIKKNLSFVEYS